MTQPSSLCLEPGTGRSQDGVQGSSLSALFVALLGARVALFQLTWKFIMERSHLSPDSLREERDEPEKYLHIARSWMIK